MHSHPRSKIEKKWNISLSLYFTSFQGLLEYKKIHILRSLDDIMNQEKLYGPKPAFKEEAVVYIVQNKVIVVLLELFIQRNILRTPGNSGVVHTLH